MNTFISRYGISYSVERSGSHIGNCTGLLNIEQSTNKRFISFKVGTDIQIDDWLTNPTGDKYLVTDKEVRHVQRRPHDLKCYVYTEAESKRNATQSATTVFNIGTASGSIIGNQNTAILNYNDTLQNMKSQISNSDSLDKKELEQIISLLEMIVNNQIPPQKGLLSKFSAVMERNSWITGSISSALLSWLTTQIH